jgi:MFS family permease
VPFAAYIRLVGRHPRLVSFGFLAALASSFGQTYVIGVFGPSLQRELDLGHTGWGVIYLIGTLASAALLPRTGKLIDRIDLRRYVAAVTALLAVACAVMAGALGPVSLVVAIFLLRHGGQGLMSHTAVTTMARYFEDGRGRAIAIASLGFAAGEALLPFAAVIAIAELGWRLSYGLVGVALAAGVLPALLWLLRGHGERHQSHLDSLASAAASGAAIARSWTRGEVLRDFRFYLLAPGVVAPALVITALFFHHLNIADAKGWSHGWITGSYVIFAGAVTSTALACGPLIDRLGGRRLVAAMLVPLALGLVFLAELDHPAAVWPYFIAIGIAVGISHTAVTAMWAELYGVAHIGAIRSLVTAVAVFASALGPVTVGALMDAGVTIDRALWYLAIYVALAAIGILLALRR